GLGARERHPPPRGANESCAPPLCAAWISCTPRGVGLRRDGVATSGRGTPRGSAEDRLVAHSALFAAQGHEEDLEDAERGVLEPIGLLRKERCSRTQELEGEPCTPPLRCAGAGEFSAEQHELERSACVSETEDLPHVGSEVVDREGREAPAGVAKGL